MKKDSFSLNVCLTFVYIILFYVVTHGLTLVHVIDDGVFIINRVFIGFYQWVYLIPILIYFKKHRKSCKGYIVGGLSLSGLNIALIIWILLDPSKFI